MDMNWRFHCQDWWQKCEEEKNVELWIIPYTLKGNKTPYIKLMLGISKRENPENKFGSEFGAMIQAHEINA